MILAAAAMFGAGYVLGTRAGRERYERILVLAKGASEQLEAFADRTSSRASSDREANASQR